MVSGPSALSGHIEDMNGNMQVANASIQQVESSIDSIDTRTERTLGGVNNLQDSITTIVSRLSAGDGEDGSDDGDGVFLACCF